MRVHLVAAVLLGLAAGICGGVPAKAGEADVVGVEARREGPGRWRFDVTVRHDDTGWDHYADKWDVVGPDGKVGPRPVTTSGMAGADFVIASGLKLGDQVIVNGLQKARPGTVVKPVPVTTTMKLENQLSAAK